MFGDYKIVLGIAPTRRDFFPDKKEAIKKKPIGQKRIYEILDKIPNIEVVDIEWLNEEGMIWDEKDAKKVAKKFKEKNVDAIFMPHYNFGQEAAVAKLGQLMQKPFLLWGPRDDAPPEGNVQRQTDSQCGLFASSKALLRYGIPFTYIENCWIDSEVLEKEINDFIRVATVVKKFKNLRVGQISLRPRQFLSVINNESELLERFGIEIVPINSAEISRTFEEAKKNNSEEIAKIKKDIVDNIDCSAMSDEEVNQIATLESAILEVARKYELDSVASECWSVYRKEFGIGGCFAFGDLTERGLPVACENDILGSVSSVMLTAAKRNETPNFLADITIRHPENDDAELLWHCGPFPKSLAKDKSKRSLYKSKGQWELKGGDVTVLRFDGCRGEYSIFCGEAKGTDGPSTNGNYIWIETDDWVKWEKKLIYGPYIHHIAGIHGKYQHIIEEALRYIDGIKKDFV